MLCCGLVGVLMLLSGVCIMYGIENVTLTPALPLLYLFLTICITCQVYRKGERTVDVSLLIWDLHGVGEAFDEDG